MIDLIKNKNKYFTEDELKQDEKSVQEGVVEKNEENKSGEEAVEKETGKQEVNLERYQDQTGLTSKRLDFGAWYIKNKNRLRIARNIFLIIFIVIFWGMFLYEFGEYSFVGLKNDREVMNQTLKKNIPSHDYFLNESAVDIKILKTGLLKQGEDQNDFYALIQNVNSSFYAEFEYYFLINGKEYGREEGFILPNESKYLLSVYNDKLPLSKNVKIQIENLKWTRVDPHNFGLWEEYRDKHLDMVVSDIEYVPSTSGSEAGKGNINNLNFSLKNNSAYNYWNIDLVIVLLNNAKVVGVDKYGAGDLLSGEEKQIDKTIVGRLGRVGEVLVYPDINITDPKVYKEFEGGIGDKR